MESGETILHTDGTATLKHIGFSSKTISVPEEETLRAFSLEPTHETVKTTVWKNDGSLGTTNWDMHYRFGLNGTDVGNECAATFSGDLWSKLKTQPFYVTFKSTESYLIRITSGWWSTEGELEFAPGNALVTDNGNGTYTLKVNLTGSKLLNVMDSQHMLFTGSGYTLEEIYLAEDVSTNIAGQLVVSSANFSVTGIGPHALSHVRNYSVKLPATISDVADQAFSASDAQAVVWQSNTPLNNDHVKDILNEWDGTYRNRLLFLNTAANDGLNLLPGMVIDGKADYSLELRDSLPFYSPQAFTANEVRYTRNFQMQSGIDSPAGWETIALPFDVSDVSTATPQVLAPFASYNGSNGLPFWLYERQGTTGFTPANSLKANTGYLICMPNNPLYDSRYNITGNVTFTGRNVTVAASPNPDGAWAEGWMAPNFTITKQGSDYYGVNALPYLANTDEEGRTPGSLFVNERGILPFEAYITKSTPVGVRQQMAINLGGDATGIKELLRVGTDGSQMVNVYNMAGQMVKRIPAGSLPEAHLAPGVYVVNGKKTIVK